MRKAILLLGLVLLAGSVSAHGGYMEDIIEHGTYQDLLDHREEVGWNAMPWIQDEDDYESMRERHELMERRHGGCHGRWT